MAELEFWAGSTPAGGILEVGSGGEFQQYFRYKIRFKTLSSVIHSTKNCICIVFNVNICFCSNEFDRSTSKSHTIKGSVQVLLLILSEFKRINQLLLFLKSSLAAKFANDFLMACYCSAELSNS